MTIARWHPEETISRQEQFILKRLKRNGKLYGFLRLQRHRLFDEAFQSELAGMYRETGAGKEANPPALMAMVLLLRDVSTISRQPLHEFTEQNLRRGGCDPRSRSDPWAAG